MYSKLFTLLLILISFSAYSQEDEEGPQKFCQELDNKEALKSRFDAIIKE